MDAAHRGLTAVSEHAPAAVQARGNLATDDPAPVHDAAAAGVSGTGSPLPHLDRIQSAFGDHDVSNVRAHVGGDARHASERMGAEAYATGDHVAFRSQPDLHTAAHEAAHVVQQRAGVQLDNGVARRATRTSETRTPWPTPWSGASLARACWDHRAAAVQRPPCRGPCSGRMPAHPQAPGRQRRYRRRRRPRATP
ncbi:MAG TPA: DUF4157 domain-containing protein [Haliangium sp.]|nr:DUF4157 domain-containing protein [Haliangium sp.]